MRCRVPLYATPGSAFFIQATGGKCIPWGKAAGLGRTKRGRDLRYKRNTEPKCGAAT